MRTVAIGCISGTSMDGIDVAVLATDGAKFVMPGPGRTYAYAPDLRAALGDFIKEPHRAVLEPLRDLEEAVTRSHVAAVRQFIADFPNETAETKLVGFHGQTVWHDPSKRFTRQLMDGALAADLLGLSVVTRFRHADVEAGGQGAPLVPLFHRAIVGESSYPVMVLNWGGVGNVTYIDGDLILAFDTGPASALLDDWTQRTSGLAFDTDGRLAAAGRVDLGILRQLLADPFFERPPPKSLDRQHFHRLASIVDGMSAADGAATLAAFTVEATVAALRHVPRSPAHWLVAGGGRHNKHLMELLARQVRVPVEPIDTIGWDGDALEAHCFGYLAVRSMVGLPLSLPSTTGVGRPMTGGTLNHPLRAQLTV